MTGTKNKIPMRKCVGCGEMKPKSALLRVIKKEGRLDLDITGKENARGAYVCRFHECFEKAVKNKGLERSLQQAISKDIYDRLEQEIVDIEKR
ncbi:MAG: YlxR family protein [Lachnospiraceae bacterium]|nr:YlxR family protein [Lachnospiraceae bacterium]